jgi:hypothetical protein
MNGERVRAMAESAYEKIKPFDWDVMAKRYLEVIERDQGQQKGNSFQTV